MWLFCDNIWYFKACSKEWPYTWHYVWHRIWTLWLAPDFMWHPKYPAPSPVSVWWCQLFSDLWVFMIVDLIPTSNSLWQNKLGGTVVAKLGQGRDEIICLRHFTAMTIGYFYNFPSFDLCLKYKKQVLRLCSFPPPVKNKYSGIGSWDILGEKSFWLTFAPPIKNYKLISDGLFMELLWSW